MSRIFEEHSRSVRHELVSKNLTEEIPFHYRWTLDQRLHVQLWINFMSSGNDQEVWRRSANKVVETLWLENEDIRKCYPRSVRKWKERNLERQLQQIYKRITIAFLLFFLHFCWSCPALRASLLGYALFIRKSVTAQQDNAHFLNDFFTDFLFYYLLVVF